MLQLVVEASGKTICFSHREGKVVVLGQDMAVGDHSHQGQTIQAVIKEIGLVVVGILQAIRVLDIKILHMQVRVEVTRIIQQEEVKWMVQSVWSVSIEEFAVSKS